MIHRKFKIFIPAKEPLYTKKNKNTRIEMKSILILFHTNLIF